jgi:hydrocephalus-inducing protein
MCAGSDPKTKGLTFELRGQGTLPVITVERPAQRDENGNPLMQFGRVFVNKAKTMNIVLRNDGILPTTCRLEMPGAVFGVMPVAAKVGGAPPQAPDNEQFRYLGRSLVTIAPQQTASVPVAYRPQALGTHLGELRLSITQNPFEDAILRFAGQAYQEDITIEGLEGAHAGAEDEGEEKKHDEAKQDELSFGDVAVGSKASHSFTLVNHSAARHRFAWPTHAALKFEPQVGHIAPHSQKTITMHFAPSEPVKLSAENVAVKLDKISLAEDDASSAAWDDQQKEVMYMTAKQLEKYQASADKKVVPERDADDEGPVTSHQLAKTEPEHTVSPDPVTAPVALKASGGADLSRYTLTTTQAAFKATMMFQSRVFKFPMRNTSTTQLSYNWNMNLTQPANVDEFAPLIPVSDLCPFSITPAKGKIAPNQEEEFTIKFSPWDAVAYECELTADVPALDPSQTLPRLRLSGSGLRPKCHVEVAASDYLSSQRRTADMRNPDGTIGALDPAAYRVVEFNSLGTRVRNTKRFFVLNPTNMSYSFEFLCQDPLTSSASASPFKCLTTKGVVLAGKRAEMIFEYMPEDVGLAESFWRFSIPEHPDISVSFLLVGTVAEPEVYLERTHVNFNALLVGSHARETVYLVNKEHLPFAFSVDPSSYQSEGAFEMEPSSGVVPPDARFPIQLRFSPPEEKPFNINAQFRIKNKPGKVVLNMKGEGYAIRESVQLEEGDGQVHILNASQLSRLDFGTVQLNERSVKRVALINSGKFSFDFQWNVPKSPLLEITPQQGTVKRGSKVYCDVTFVGAEENVLDRLRAVCTLSGGARQYVMLLSGTARKPLLEMSSHDIDFGAQLVGARPTTQTLRVTNREPNRNITVETIWENKPYLEIRGSAAVLAPGESTEFQFIFTPRELQPYNETVRLELNGVYGIPVPVRGEGQALRLDVGTGLVQFGNLRLGSSLTRGVKVTNPTKKTLRLALKLSEGLLPLAASSSASASASALEHKEDGKSNALGISFLPHPTPNMTLELRPRQTIEMMVRFAPSTRLAAFNEEVAVEVEGLVRPLFRVAGSCSSVGLSFESDNIPFGPVVLHSALTKRVMLENVGDVGCRFRFDPSQFAPDFSVTPLEGFVPAQDSLSVDFSFHPQRVNNDIRLNRIPCTIDGASTLYLTFTGACLPPPDEEAKELKFETKVRSTTTRAVVLENPTSVKWTLSPSLNHESWSIPESVEVPALGKAEVDVTYRPLATIGADAPEKTQLFFPLPNGQALIYNLTGVSTAPDAVDTIEVDAPCKKLLLKSLPVKNWLSKAQRFKVVIETEQQDPSVAIKGAASIEVPGMLEREFKLSFYAYKEGVTKSTIRFVNETTNEYMFYNMVFKATKAGILANLVMEVRICVCMYIPSIKGCVCICICMCM